jgi:hypothetical protein|tara:strand:- start:10 stop:258 length:249 start_codon:yes stop_codon:yes gene_type:complete
MAIIAQEEEIKYITVDGKQVLKYKPRVEITIKHLESGKEYASEEEAQADVDSPDTNTTQKHISKSVHVKVIGLPMGADTNIM